MATPENTQAAAAVTKIAFESAISVLRGKLMGVDSVEIQKAPPGSPFRKQYVFRDGRGVVLAIIQHED